MKRGLAALGLVLMAVGCASPSASPRTSEPGAPPRAETPTASTARIDSSQAARLQRLMVPLVKAMDRQRSLDQVKVGVMDDEHINAANAGGGQFFVTKGLLEKANDDQLQAVLAHEVAHEDLGHVAKAQALGVGLNIGMIVLDQIIPGSGALTPLAGALISRGYSRTEEYQADRHGVELLQRVGKPKQQMIDTLTWLMKAEGGSSGGFLATHPATGDRIEALQQLK